jgi:hypothetical protein
VASLSVTGSGDGTGPSTTNFAYSSGYTAVTDPQSNGTGYTYDSTGQVTDAQDIGPDDDAVNSFAAQVESLGETSYSSTFGGAMLTASGTVDVYSNSQTDSQLRAAIASLDTSGIPVQYIQATRSYSQLDSLSSTVGGAASSLAGDGIEVVAVASDPSTDTAQATVVAPSSSDMAKLGAVPSVRAQFGTITSAKYSQAATLLLSEDYGPGVSVGSAYASAPQATAAGALNDKSPWTGGDYISGDYGQCTGGFMVKGNASGHIFMLTAGHCGTSKYINGPGGATIGTTSSRYILNPQFDDFQTISVSGGKPYIWLGANSAMPVSGENIPAAGSGRVTTDGVITGPRYGNRVLANNAFTTGFKYDGQTGREYAVAHLILIGGPVCQRGDSGGPVVLRTASGRSVKAVGTIVGYYGLQSGGIICAAERIGSEEARSNTSLLLWQGS